MLYIFTINVNFNLIKMLMFCNVQTTNMTSVDKRKWDRYVVNNCNTV